MMRKMCVEFVGCWERWICCCIIFVFVVVVLSMFIRNVFCSGLIIVMFGSVRYGFFVLCRGLSYIRFFLGICGR